MKAKEYHLYADMCSRVAELSTANRKQVGSVLVTQDDVILIGYNGTPRGLSNVCEDEDGKTHPWVLHSESNAIMKATKAGVSLKGSTLFCNYSPCPSCCNLIIQSGVNKVVYKEEFRDISGLDTLIACGVTIEKYNENKD